MQLLNSIWHLADHNKDGKLSVNEFAVAFHLILCVSKKRLPLPPGGLPPPLIALVANSGVAPPQPHVKKSIGEAFGDLDDDVGSLGSLGSHSQAPSGVMPAPARSPVLAATPSPASVPSYSLPRSSSGPSGPAAGTARPSASVVGTESASVRCSAV